MADTSNITKYMNKLKAEKLKQREYYWLQSILGNDWAFFYILIGAREAGKSYAVMDWFLNRWKNHGETFIWLRLTESSQKKLLSNRANNFVDPDLSRKYNLKLTVKGFNIYDDGKHMATILTLSTFYNDKGVALYDNEYLGNYNICLDEMNRERSERRTFDITYNFVNQLENLVRSRKYGLKIFLIGNTLEEASDIMCNFNFAPQKFGRYKLKGKKAVVDYIPNSEAYLERRKGTVSDLLAPEASNFTNKIEIDTSQIYKGRLIRPTYIVMFTKDLKFTIWDGGVIAPYNKEKVREIALKPHLDVVYLVEFKNAVVAQYNAKGYKYRNVLVQSTFKKYLDIYLGVR